MRGVRLSLVLLAAGTIVAGPTAAQQPARLPPGAVVQPLGRDDGAELRRHLTTLADNPRSFDALIGAGRAALRMGDAEAALTFFGRAEQISPRDARVKAGMASCFVHLGRAAAALNLFAEAVALGAPVAEVAGDRGLAYDMVGDPRRAQQDYTLSLRLRPDPEIQRRMALSLAISGERDAALRIIDPQLRRNDRAAWRTQALVLALTGDAAGASRTAQGSMPPGAAQAMAPFLARLAALNPQQKAMAVHFGHFPAGGRVQAGAQVDTSADPGALALAYGGATPPREVQAEAEEPTRSSSRRRPGRRSAGGASRSARAETRDSSDPYGLRGTRRAQRDTRRETRPAAQRPVQVAQADAPQQPQPQPAQPRPQPQASPPQAAPPPSRWAGAPVIPQAQPQIQPQVQPQRPAPAAPQSQPTPQPQPQAPAQLLPQSGMTSSTVSQQPVATPALPAPVPGEAREPAPIQVTDLPASEVAIRSTAESPPPVVSAEGAAPGFDLAEARPRPPADQAPAETPPQAPADEPLADIESVVNALPQEPAPAPAPARPESRPEPRPVRTAERTPPAPAQARPRQPAHPIRHWVQIAGGADRAALPREFARLRERAPELAGQSAWTTPLNATNRLLVGPFASAREAQQFVNQLAQREIAAFAWTSPAGQEIHRLQTGR